MMWAGTVATHVLALHDVQLHIGAVAFPADFVIALGQFPATVQLSVTASEPLFDANALVASSKANPSSKPLEILNAFMPTPFFFPDKRREAVSRRLGIALRKELAFVRGRPE